MNWKYQLLVPGFFAVLYLISGFSVDDQDCATCPAFKVGFKYTKVEFGADGKSQGSTTIVVDSVLSRNDTLYSFCTITGTSASLQPVNQQCIQWCANNNYSVDLVGTMRTVPSADEIARSYEITPVVFPLNLKKGDTLAGGRMKVVIQEKYGRSTTEVTWENRICIGEDTVRVKNKTINCQKIETNSHVTLKLGPTTMMDTRLRIVQWFSPSYGVLKSETFNKDKFLRYERVVSITEGKAE